MFSYKHQAVYQTASLQCILNVLNPTSGALSDMLPG